MFCTASHVIFNHVSGEGGRTEGGRRDGGRMEDGAWRKEDGGRRKDHGAWSMEQCVLYYKWECTVVLLKGVQ